jgi:hypothetical protein
MSNPIPGLLALTSIADGSAQQAAPIRNNYSAIQAAANEIIAALNSGTVGQPLLSAGATALQWGPKTTTSTLAGGPPGSPVDQDIWIATAVDANGTRWAFQYNAGSASAFKWEFIGGAPTSAEVLTSETTASTADTDLATVGPSITLPRAGDYLYSFDVQMANTGVSTNVTVLKPGAAAASDDDSGNYTTAAGGHNGNASRTRRLNGAAAGDVWKLQYRVTAGTGTFLRRNLKIWPVRIA